MSIIEELSKLKKDEEPLRLDFKAYQNMDSNDGIDHIRIDRHAVTTLGKNLCVDYVRVFYHPEYGSFVSIQAAIEWLKLKHKDENVRSLSGLQLEEYIKKEISEGRNYYETKMIKDEDMASIIFYSLVSKPELLEMLDSNKLPFCYYFVVGDGYAKVQHIHYTNMLTRVVPYVLNQKSIH